MTTSLLPLPHQSPGIEDTAYILTGYDLSAPPYPLPRFGEDVWDLFAWRGKLHQNRSDFVVDFRRLPNPERRLIAKEYLYARLNIRNRKHPRLAISHLRAEFDYLVTFLTYLDRELGGMPLQELTQSMLDGFLLWSPRGPQDTPRSPKSIYRSALIVTKLAAYQEYFSGDRLVLIPWEGRNAAQVASWKKASENVTPRIPEVVLNPLIQWALFYVQTAAPDILAVRQEWARLSAQKAPEKTRIERLAAWLEQRRAEKRGVPAHEPGFFLKSRSARGHPDVSYRLIALMSGGINGIMLPNTFAMIQKAVAELGLELGGMDTMIIGRLPDGQPWRSRFSIPSLKHETHMLMAACYIVVAYFSGMRENEIVNLKRGCHVTETTADGQKTRHKVRGKTFKHQGRQGTEATWVVIEPVAEAIAILEQLSSHEYLFRPPSLRESDTQQVAIQARRYLNVFRDHINATQQHHDQPPIPDVEGVPWRLSSAQFRRTLAWHIANQPFGIVAGKIQYQHVSVTTFEGYAGQSASGFKSEIEAERRLQQMEDIVERYEEVRQGGRLAGPGAAMINQIFRKVREELGDFPGHISDTARVRSMLLNVGRMLYPGILNDCYFDPSVARCLQGTKKDAPLLMQCHPDRCANSCISERHLPQWRRAIADAEGHLGQQRLSDYQKHALTTTIVEMKRVIAPFEGGANAHKGTDREQATSGDGTVVEGRGDTD
ncbi:MAG TPA: hypothetical protein VKT82_23275 [Ktedonobacterales bacterium]|nr:hypothetical protein [Ktedonobacterales bacterium]